MLFNFNFVFLGGGGGMRGRWGRLCFNKYNVVYKQIPVFFQRGRLIFVLSIDSGATSWAPIPFTRIFII